MFKVNKWQKEFLKKAQKEGIAILDFEGVNDSKEPKLCFKIRIKNETDHFQKSRQLESITSSNYAFKVYYNPNLN